MAWGLALNSKVFFLTFIIIIISSCGVKSKPKLNENELVKSVLNQYLEEDEKEKKELLKKKQ